MRKKLTTPAGYGHRVIPSRSWLKTHPEDKETIQRWNSAARFVVVDSQGGLKDALNTREEARRQASHLTAVEYCSDRVYGLVNELADHFGEDIDMGAVLDDVHATTAL
jgi:hypothetical protein